MGSFALDTPALQQFGTFPLFPCFVLVTALLQLTTSFVHINDIGGEVCATYIKAFNWLYWCGLWYPNLCVAVWKKFCMSKGFTASVNSRVLAAVHSWSLRSLVLFGRFCCHLTGFCSQCASHGSVHVLLSMSMPTHILLLGPFEFIGSISKMFQSWTWRIVSLIVYRHRRLSHFHFCSFRWYEFYGFPTTDLSGDCDFPTSSDCLYFRKVVSDWR